MEAIATVLTEGEGDEPNCRTPQEAVLPSPSRIRPGVRAARPAVLVDTGARCNARAHASRARGVECPQSKDRRALLADALAGFRRPDIVRASRGVGVDKHLSARTVNLHKVLYHHPVLTTSDLVARIRGANGDTQEGLARRLGVSYPTINSWERGRSEPHPARRRELEDLAESLGIRAELSVLVIDDDPVTAEIVRAATRRVDASVTVGAALDGWEGLVACGAQQPQLLFLDVMMPGIDGLEVARRLPAIDGLEKMRVVFVTASQSAEVLTRAKSLGHSVLNKPLEFDQLARVMTETLEALD